MRFLLALVFVNVLFGDVWQAPSSIYESGPIANVFGVNVITGDFVANELLLTLPGPEPLEIRETYNSYSFWQTNLSGIIREQADDDVISSSYYEPGRGILYFQAENAKTIELKPGMNRTRGVTNVGQGIISGQTNHYNRTYHSHRVFGDVVGPTEISMDCGDGTKKSFGRLGKKGNLRTFLLSEERRPSGLTFKLLSQDSLIQYDWFAGNDLLSQAKIFTASEHTSQMTAVQPESGASTKSLIFDRAYKRGVYNIYKSIHRNYSFPLYFDYWERELPKTEGYRQFTYPMTMRQEGMSSGDHSTFYIHYYDVHRKEVSKEDKKRLRHEEQHAKVQRLEQTFEKGIKVRLAEFFYFPGHTDVAYEKGCIERYHRDKEDRIILIERFDGKIEPEKCLSKEKYEWSETGNLLKKQSIRRDEEIRETVEFTYDERGNVLKKVTIADFSGRGYGEKLEEVFTYSVDGYNLLISEDNGRVKKSYRYQPKTNLVTAILVEEDGKIIQRRFVHYGKYATPILKIEDDGCSEDEEDLTAVTERRIERLDYYDEIPLRGFLKKRLESYFDPFKGTEVPLKSSVYFYDERCNLKERKVYDADGKFACELLTDYNSHSLLTREVDALGYATTFVYNDIDLPLSSTGPLSKKSAEYNFAKLPTKEGVVSLEGEDFSSSYTYNNKLNRIKVTDPRLQSTDYIYDSFGREVESIGPQQVTSNGIVRPSFKKAYDSDGNITREEDALGRVTQKKYNSYGKITEIIHPDGSQERFVYDLYGNQVEHIARNEMVTYFTYDGLGNETFKASYSKEGALLSSSCKRYSGFQLIEEINPLGLVTQYVHDGAGRLIKKCEGAYITTYSYDSLGYLSEKREPERVITRYTYDLKGQVLSEAVYSSNETLQKRDEYRYDADGRRVAIINQTSGGVALSSTEYDYLGRVINTTDPLGNSLHTEYFDYHLNELGQQVLRKVNTDAIGRITEEVHDAYERIVHRRRYRPLEHLVAEEHNLFDAVGNLTEKRHVILYKGIVEDQQIVRFEYNSMNQVTCLTESPDRSHQRITRTYYTPFGEKSLTIKPDGSELHYDYNGYGAVDRIYSTNAEVNVDYSFSYNPLLQVVTATDELSGTTVKRSYDSRGNQIREEFLPHWSVTTEYDGLSRPIHFSYGSFLTMRHEYEGILLHRVLAIDGKDQYSAEYGDYDQSARHHSVTYPQSSGTLTLKRDLNGREIAISHEHFSQKNIIYSPVGEILSDLINGAVRTFDYDGLSQLVEEKSLMPNRYTYDSLYRRRSKNEDHYLHSPLNELLNDGKQELAYDLCGRCIVDGEKRYTFNALDRLVKVTTPLETITYTYDAFGRCLSRSDVHFLYQGEDEIGTVKKGKVEEFRFLGKGKGAEIGAAVLLKVKGRCFTPLFDLQGSTTALISLSGKLLNEYSYSAFGEIKYSENYRSYLFSTAESPWLFASKRLDPTLNCYQFGRRHYIASRGHWLTPDPKGYSEGPNLYAYVQNSPLILFDLYGLEAALEEGSWFSSSYFQGSMQAIGGFSEAFMGTAMAATVWGAPLGFPVFLHGTDRFTAGVTTLLTGKHTRTLTSQGLEMAGFSTPAADFLDDGLSVTGTTVGLKAVASVPGLTRAFELSFRGCTNASRGLAAEVSIGVEGNFAVNTERAVEKGTYSVYKGLDSLGKTRYVGITSRDPLLRFQEHYRAYGTGREMLDYRTIRSAQNLTLMEVRIWEQQLINEFGLSKNGGQLLNMKNSIAPKHWPEYGIK